MLNECVISQQDGSKGSWLSILGDVDVGESMGEKFVVLNEHSLIPRDWCTYTGYSQSSIILGWSNSPLTDIPLSCGSMEELLKL